VPMLVIRYMIPLDLPFLKRPSDALKDRLRFVHSYLKHWQAALSPIRRAEALQALTELQSEARFSAVHPR
jgi:hypothetical protein